MDPATMMLVGQTLGGGSGGGGVPGGAGKPDTNSSAAESSVRGPVNISVDSGGINLGEIVKQLEGAGPPENGGWGVVAPSAQFGRTRQSILDGDTLDAGLLPGFSIGKLLAAGAVGLIVALIAKRYGGA